MPHKFCIFYEFSVSSHNHNCYVAWMRCVSTNWASFSLHVPLLLDVIDDGSFVFVVDEDEDDVFYSDLESLLWLLEQQKRYPCPASVTFSATSQPVLSHASFASCWSTSIRSLHATVSFVIAWITHGWAAW